MREIYAFGKKVVVTTAEVEIAVGGGGGGGGNGGSGGDGGSDGDVVRVKNRSAFEEHKHKVHK